jgi:uncharacterized protein (TIGR02594 family)
MPSVNFRCCSTTGCDHARGCGSMEISAPRRRRQSSSFSLRTGSRLTVLLELKLGHRSDHQATTFKATTDEVAWCAAFVNWCLIQANKKGCNSAAAIDWVKWGMKLEQPRVGAITIIHNKKKGKVVDAFTGSRSGNHVSFFISQLSSYITLFGGSHIARSNNPPTSSRSSRSWVTGGPWVDDSAASSAH